MGAVDDEGRNCETSGMRVRIGFIGGEGSEALAEAVRPLLPPDACYEVLTLETATQRVIARELTVLIVAIDGPMWRETLAGMMELQATGEKYPLAVFALVPRDEPTAMAQAFDLHVADVAGLPMDTDEVRIRLASLVRRRQVAHIRAAETRAAWRLAVIDPLTGLYNRHHLDSVLPAAFEAARARGQPLSVLMIDVDALKPFNDRWGHAAGDRVLRTLAEALQADLPKTHTVARFGGDEIVVVMPETDHAMALSVAARLVDVVARTPVGQTAEVPTHMTISVGLATMTDSDVDVEALLIRADAALYDAKRGGRNRVAQAA